MRAMRLAGVLLLLWAAGCGEDAEAAEDGGSRSSEDGGGACVGTACDDGGPPCEGDVCDGGAREGDAGGGGLDAGAGECASAADCDDGDPCTTDGCDGDVCSHTPVPGCGTTELPFDDFPLDVPESIPSAADYTSIVHIDPSYGGGDGDGSMARPYASWSDALPFAPGTAYLQRRGTTATPSFDVLVIGQDGVLVGAYGTGDRPALRVPVSVQADDVTVRDLDISTPSGGDICLEIQHPSPHRERTVIYNNVIHGCYAGLWSAGYHTRVLNNEVYDIVEDGLFFQYAHDFEVAHNHVHGVNTAFFIDPSEDYASGDAIQLDLTDRWWVHHNVLDRTDTGNKFCFIATRNFPDDDLQEGVLEHNSLAGPLARGDGGASVFIGGTSRDIVVRNNRFVGADEPTVPAIYHHTDLDVYGNIFVGTGGGVWTASRSSNVYNNLFLDIRGDVFRLGTVYSRNNIFGTRDGQSGVAEESNNLYLTDHTLDEVFVDAAAGDYRLAPGSPAIDAADWHVSFDEQYEIDQTGRAVPHDDGLDVGPHQSGS